MPESSGTTVGIVIPVHNRRELTLQCLRSLSRVLLDNLAVRIFVIDDGSTDGTASAIAEEYPDVVVIRGDGNLYYTAATNLGIEAAIAAGSEFIVCMNDDSIVHEAFIERLLNIARTEPRAILGGLLLRWDRPHEVYQCGPVWRTLKGGWVWPPATPAWSVRRPVWPVEFLAGNCLLIPRQAITEAGKMDDARFPQYGDAEFSPRLKRLGWKLLIASDAYVWVEPNRVSSLHKMGVRQALRRLFRDPYSSQNLKHNFLKAWVSAPTRVEGVLAFCVLLARMLVRGLQVCFAAE